MRRVIVSMLLAAVLFCLGGCDNDNDRFVPTPPEQPLGVSGHWKISEVPPDIALMMFALEQTDGTVVGVAPGMSIAGTVSDDTFTWVGQTEWPDTYCTTTMTRTDADEFCGWIEAYEGDVLVETFSACLVRCYLSGNFTAEGIINGMAIDVDTLDEGWGGIAGTGGIAEYLRFGYAIPALGLTFRVTDAANAGVGTFLVPNELDVELHLSTPTEAKSRRATLGTLVIEKFDATGFRATYDISFEGGGNLIGSFDVSWDILAGDPFP